MKILVLGGTRLLGLALVRRLASEEHELTVVSRRTAPFPETVRNIRADRQDGLQQIAGECFDLIFDFLAYDGAAISDALSAIPQGTYVLISSVWLVRLAPGLAVDRVLTNPSDDALLQLPEVTRRYLLGKLAAEKIVTGPRRLARPMLILRMPIFWGAQEHTGRVRFYAERIADGKPLMLINGGMNLTQIAWSEDLATAMAAALPLLVKAEAMIWEALPHEGITVRQVIADIASGTTICPAFREHDAASLQDCFPEYLEAEPLWRECASARSETNLFALAGTIPTPQALWLPACCEMAGGDARLDLRKRELALFGERRSCSLR